MDINPGLFRRQFLLTRESCTSLGWNAVQVAEYHLYTHPDLELTTVSNATVELFLLGFWFDHRHPEWTNHDIFSSLLSCSSFEDLLVRTDHLGGRFVCIYRSQDTIRLFHDACGQREVFYDTTFSAFGSQPKLIEKVIKGEEINDPEAIEFFQSKAFQKERMFVMDLTHRRNIRHLLPNHFADLRTTSVHRYFPVARVEQGVVPDVSQKAIEMLQGFIKAASLRYPLELGVTAGYDSRILFLASLPTVCEYYVERNSEQENPLDVQFSQELVSIHGKSIEVREQRQFQPSEEALAIYSGSIDFPKGQNSRRKPSDKMVINGHLSEIARNYFTYKINLKDLDHVTGEDLALLYKFPGSGYAAHLYDSWLSAIKPILRQTGYNYLDLFYWEERLGNWCAKGKSEVALSGEIYSPFCSRTLLKLLLSIDKRHRNKYQSKLHDTMIHKMSPLALKVPINPTRTNKDMRLLKKIGLFEFDQRYGVISRILRNLPFR